MPTASNKMIVEIFRYIFDRKDEKRLIEPLYKVYSFSTNALILRSVASVFCSSILALT